MPEHLSSVEGQLRALDKEKSVGAAGTPSMTKAAAGFFLFGRPSVVANRVLNILVAQIGLQPASIVSRIRQRIAATMAQHVRVDREGHFGPSKTRPRPLPCPRFAVPASARNAGRRSGNFFPICCAGALRGLSPLSGCSASWAPRSAAMLKSRSSAAEMTSMEKDALA